MIIGLGEGAAAAVGCSGGVMLIVCALQALRIRARIEAMHRQIVELL